MRSILIVLVLAFAMGCGSGHHGAPLTITTNTLPNARIGSAYQAQLSATGGTPPYHWSIQGTLPPGLVLDPETGLISGVVQSGSHLSYTFVASVTDSL